MKKLAAAAAIAALGVAGPAAGASKPQKRSLSADSGGGLRFSRATLHAGPGAVKLVMHNPKGSGVAHGIAIGGKRGAVVGPGGTSSVRISLKRGTYTYFCPVAGHRAAGMKGKLVIG